MFLPLNMTIGPSRTLLRVLAILHAMSIGVVLLLPAPLFIKDFLVAALVVSMAWQGAFSRRFRPGQKIRAVRVDSKQSLWLEGLDWEPQPAELINAWLGPKLGVAAINCRGKTHRLVWMPDSASQDEIRRWHVWLRWRTGSSI